ncbi:UNVERIFIED_ORG: putative transcriptional regulator [Lelliottia amnigena]|nr:putative transcriptional regulator [Lelliottia amnigena]
MEIDLCMCRALLERLMQSYTSLDTEELQDDLLEISGSDEGYIAHITYLSEHGLVKANLKRGHNAYMLLMPPEITAKGLDFIRKDGGLSALIDRSNVNYQLHEALLSELLRQIQRSHESAPRKEALSSQLRALPAETIKHLYLKFLDQGASRLPEVFQLIQTLLRQG